MEELPADLRGPVQVALARATEQLPYPGALPGGVIYEPKWDGYRMAPVRTQDAARMWSRNGTDLTARFPEIAAALEEQVPPGCVIDAELVAWSGSRLDFSALQKRMVAGKAMIPGLARKSPAALVAFDVLAVAGHDARAMPLRQRRDLLEELVKEWRPPLQTSPATTDADEASHWLAEWHVAGIEGVMAKGAGQRYEPGKRQWLKVKHRDTVDVVLGAVVGSRARQ